MISLTKSQKQKLIETLSKFENGKSKEILEKLNNEKEPKYVYSSIGIRALLKKAYQQKKKVKIRYYSLSSDEVRWRKVAIYQFNPDFIIAYCYLRNGERVFKTARISQAAILDEKYKIPRDWSPESIVYSK